MSKTTSTKSDNARLLAASAVVIGIVLVLAAVFADEIGLSGGGEGVGWKQLIAAIAGLIISFAGIGWLLQHHRFESTR